MTAQRVSFRELFGSAFTGPTSDGDTLTMLLIDIDGCSYWPYFFGWDIVERMIEEVVLRIERAATSGFVARVGFDEIALIFAGPRQTDGDVAHLTRRILDAIAAAPIPVLDWLGDQRMVSWPPETWPSGMPRVGIEELRVTAKALVISEDMSQASTLASWGDDPQHWFDHVPGDGRIGPNSLYVVPTIVSAVTA